MAFCGLKEKSQEGAQTVLVFEHRKRVEIVIWQQSLHEATFWKTKMEMHILKMGLVYLLFIRVHGISPNLMCGTLNLKRKAGP